MSFFEQDAAALDQPPRAAQLEYTRIRGSTGLGDKYEERASALLFLRCLREGLRFRLSTNDAAAGKFDDLVLRWRDEATGDQSALLVQLKHKTSAKQTTVDKSSLMRERTSKQNKDFSIDLYQYSYNSIKDSLRGGSYAVVLLTNLDLDNDAKDMFEEHDPESFPGMKLLNVGGRLYRLKPGDEDVKSVVQDYQFTQHFYLYCNQSNAEDIKGYIYKELEVLLSAEKKCCDSMCENLCTVLRKWMNEKIGYYLTSSWDSWLNIVETYIREEVTACNGIATRIRYGRVGTLAAYIQDNNPAWVRPPGANAAALSATKVHQAIRDEKHIMVNVTCLRELEEKIVCCWGPFCRWLVALEGVLGWESSHMAACHLPTEESVSRGEREQTLASPWL